MQSILKYNLDRLRDHKPDIWLIENKVNWSDSERKTENEIRHNWSGSTKGTKIFLISIVPSQSSKFLIIQSGAQKNYKMSCVYYFDVNLPSLFFIVSLQDISNMHICYSFFHLYSNLHQYYLFTQPLTVCHAGNFAISHFVKCKSHGIPTHEKGGGGEKEMARTVKFSRCFRIPRERSAHRNAQRRKEKFDRLPLPRNVTPPRDPVPS